MMYDTYIDINIAGTPFDQCGACSGSPQSFGIIQILFIVSCSHQWFFFSTWFSYKIINNMFVWSLHYVFYLFILILILNLFMLWLFIQYQDKLSCIITFVVLFVTYECTQKLNWNELHTSLDVIKSLCKIVKAELSTLCFHELGSP